MNHIIEEKIHSIYTTLSQKRYATDFSLLTGNCGITLFLQQYNCFFNNQSSIETTQRMEYCFDIIQRTPNISFSHYSGIAGVVWLYHFLEKEGFYNREHNLIEDVYPYLAKSSIQKITHGNYDPIHGSIGEIIWILDKINPNEIEGFINTLNEIAVKDGTCIYWETEGEIRLGLAHGIPGIVYFLCKCHKRGISQEICEKLISGSLNFILKNKFTPLKKSLYPQTIHSSIESSDSRLGWCWGDLGIALCFWQAGIVIDNQSWQQEAIKIMLHAANRLDLDENKVIDAGLCHGTSGIAHIFNRFYWNTQIPIFKETANFWINKTIEMAIHKDGLVGYKSFKGNNLHYQNEYGLLEGISGIGLSLLSYLNGKEPTWDECLLLS